MWLRVLLAGVAGGIAMFFVGFVTHGIFHLQSRTFANIPEGASFIEYLEGRSLKPGFYIFPDMPTGPDLNDPNKMAEASERFKNGTSGLLLVAPKGMNEIGEMLGK